MNEDYFFTAISDMETKLKNDPDIELLTFHVFPPVNETYLETLEKYQLPETFLSFYKYTNGLQVRWISKKDEYYNPKIHHWKYGPFFDPNKIDVSTAYYDYYDGVINILPLETMFETSWKGTTWQDWNKDYTLKINGKELNGYEFLVSLRPFDLFSESNAVNLVLHEKPGFKSMFMQSEDKFADFKCSKFLSFEEYMNHLFINNGLWNCRGIFKLY